MAVNYNPKIVTDGLVLYLDAGNTKSYPGTGTVWTDLSPSKTNGTLINGPTFNSSNGGSIVFDGLNDRINFPFSNVFDISGSITMEGFIYPTSYTPSNGGMLITKVESYYSELGSNQKLKAYFYGLSSEGYHESTSTIPLNKWTYFAITRSNISNTIVFYINGVVDKTISSVTGSIRVQQNYFLTMGGYVSGSDYQYIGRIANGKLYNRALTASEIAQNFNATRGRFGI